MNEPTLVIPMGRAGRDPQFKTLPSGAQVADIGMAVNTKTGNYDDHENTTWYNISFWNQLAEFARQNLRQGARFGVIGTQTVRTYQRRDGTLGFSIDIRANQVTIIDWPADENTPAGIDFAEIDFAESSPPNVAVSTPTPVSAAHQLEADIFDDHDTAIAEDDDPFDDPFEDSPSPEQTPETVHIQQSLI